MHFNIRTTDIYFRQVFVIHIQSEHSMHYEDILLFLYAENQAHLKAQLLDLIFAIYTKPFYAIYILFVLYYTITILFYFFYYSHFATYQSFVNELQSRISVYPDKIPKLLHSIHTSALDIKFRQLSTCVNCCIKRKKYIHNIPASVTIDETLIPAKQSIRNFGATSETILLSFCE